MTTWSYFKHRSSAGQTMDARPFLTVHIDDQGEHGHSQQFKISTTKEER